ncbi:hypothetical protein ZWY2020_027556 [Hordeum vulgare]|nr:hypothetical protein ZWY2020_027556 [Hordeum vulgare]
MGKAARSKAAKRTAVACAGDGKEQQRKAMPETDAQKVARKRALLAFGKAAYAEAMRYINMEEEDVVEEYRRAGKLHNYDQDKEWKKRFARVYILHPCPCSKKMAAKIEEYKFYLEEDEDDFRMGLYSLIGPGDES